MQESLEVTLPSKQEEDEKDQPAEMEYLNSRCVLFTYFQGDIGSVVDEHFSRALSQVSSFSPETALTKSKAGLNPLWRGKRSILWCGRVYIMVIHTALQLKFCSSVEVGKSPQIWKNQGASQGWVIWSVKVGKRCQRRERSRHVPLLP